MTYSEWFDEFANKHKKIVDKLLLQNYSKEQIIEYFEFENMVKKENEFCLLYKTETKCHDMEDLNCYLCACPNFRFNDEGLDTYNKLNILSKCTIDNGSKFAVNDVMHQDCSKCTVPHHKAYIEKHFDYDWRKIMKECSS